MRWKALGSSGLNQLRDELHLREDTWLFVVDVTAFDGWPCSERTWRLLHLAVGVDG